MFFFFFQAEDGIRDHCVTGVQTCALPIFSGPADLAAVQWGLPGPVHLNIQLDAPLVPEEPVVGSSLVASAPRTSTTDASVAEVRGRPRPGLETTLPRGPRTVVVAGDDAGPPAR